MEKKRYRGKRARKRVQRGRRRTGLYVFLGLVVLTLGGLIFFGTDLTLQSSSGVVERAEEPTVTKAPEAIKQPATEEEAADQETAEEEAAPTPPNDPTLYLTIPKLGIFNALIANDESGLELGAMHLPETGFPWEKGANAYIAGHRLGFEGTGSYHIFYSLPSLGPGDEITLTDAAGQTYNYRVSEILQVDPTDMGVIEPTGKDMVSLQTCIENYGDFVTLGPNWNVRFIVRGEQVA